MDSDSITPKEIAASDRSIQSNVDFNSSESASIFSNHHTWGYHLPGTLVLPTWLCSCTACRLRNNPELQGEAYLHEKEHLSEVEGDLRLKSPIDHLAPFVLSR